MIVLSPTDDIRESDAYRRAILPVLFSLEDLESIRLKYRKRIWLPWKRFEMAWLTVISRLRNRGIRSRRAAQMEIYGEAQAVDRLAFATNRVDFDWRNVVFSNETIISSDYEGPVRVYREDGLRNDQRYELEFLTPSQAMPRRKTEEAKRLIWNSNSIEKAIESVISGDISLRGASSYHLLLSNVHSTVNKEKEKHAGLIPRVTGKIGHPTVKRAAFDLVVASQIQHPWNPDIKVAADDWFKAFLKRDSNINLKKPEGISRARAQARNAAASVGSAVKRFSCTSIMPFSVEAVPKEKCSPSELFESTPEETNQCNRDHVITDRPTPGPANMTDPQEHDRNPPENSQKSPSDSPVIAIRAILNSPEKKTCLRKRKLLTSLHFTSQEHINEIRYKKSSAVNTRPKGKNKSGSKLRVMQRASSSAPSNEDELLFKGIHVERREDPMPDVRHMVSRGVRKCQRMPKEKVLAGWLFYDRRSELSRAWHFKRSTMALVTARGGGRGAGACVWLWSVASRPAPSVGDVQRGGAFMSHFKDYKFFRSFSAKVEGWPLRKAEQLWRRLRERKIAGLEFTQALRLKMVLVSVMDSKVTALMATLRAHSLEVMCSGGCFGG
ncbi:hypothetical protein ANN_18818 [Periplaneta americana]|uniref:Uncharacterized protein n=1 Tax=Periplaneta americana TaxID=6978 RepID=A0ABQ8SQJ3_PERAM|nr:hypothetical protein ANN_18818 [Periplaneta americana]